MKRIASVLSSRMFMVALAIILQFSWLFLTLYDFSVRFTFVEIAIRILAFFLVLVVVNNWTNPYYKLAWTCIILVVPVLGITLYLVFGRSQLTKKTQERMDAVHREVSACLQIDYAAIKSLEKEDRGRGTAVQIYSQLGAVSPVPQFQNQILFFRRKNVCGYVRGNGTGGTLYFSGIFYHR